jgi:arylformamidase
MRIFHDLTHPLVPGMPVYPGDPPVAFSPAATIETNGFRVTQVSFGTHAGTHLDAPSHFLAAGSGVEAIPLERLIGPAQVLDLAAMGPAAQFERGARLLVRTGWSKRWGSDGYFEGFPSLPDWLVEALIEGPVGLVGLETPSIDPNHERDSALHLRLLSAGVVIVENLTRLKALPDQVDLAVLPLRLDGLDGSPCRAVAWS